VASLYHQSIAADGMPVGSETHINQILYVTPTAGSMPALASSGMSGFAVWEAGGDVVGAVVMP
jgi:hypothetical protein